MSNGNSIISNPSGDTSSHGNSSCGGDNLDDDGFDAAPDFFVPALNKFVGYPTTPYRFKVSITGGLFWWNKQWCGFKRNYLTLQVQSNFSYLDNMELDGQKIESIKVVLKVRETCWKGQKVKLQQYDSKRVYTGEVEPLLLNKDNPSATFKRLIFSRSSTEFFVLECLFVAKIGAREMELGSFQSIPFKILKGTKSKYPTIPLYLERQKNEIDKLSISSYNDANVLPSIRISDCAKGKVSPTNSDKSWSNPSISNAWNSLDSKGYIKQEPTPTKELCEQSSWDQVLDQALIEAGINSRPHKRFRPWE